MGEGEAIGRGGGKAVVEEGSGVWGVSDAEQHASARFGTLRAHFGTLRHTSARFSAAQRGADGVGEVLILS